MNCIVAVSPSWGIGRKGGLLYSLKGDMKFFREMTADAVLIMGRKTLESFPGGKPLKNRRNIVITRDKSYEVSGAEIVHSTEEALERVKELPQETVFVIGGAEIYRQLLPYCKTAYVTMVAEEPLEKAEAYFPNLLTEAAWTLADRGPVQEENGFHYRFCRWEKSRS